MSVILRRRPVTQPIVRAEFRAGGIGVDVEPGRGGRAEFTVLAGTVFTGRGTFKHFDVADVTHAELTEFRDALTEMLNQTKPGDTLTPF